MKILKACMFSTVLFCSISAAHSKDEWDEALDEAHLLARLTLETFNKQSGIEHLGGPFRFEDYEVLTKRRETSKFKRLRVIYKYKRPNKIEGHPDEFDISVEWDISWPFKKVNNIRFEKGEIDVIGEFKTGEIDKILKIIPTYDDTYSEPNYFSCIIMVDNQGKINRIEKELNQIHSIKRLSNERIQIFYNRGLRTSAFEDYVLIRANISFVQKEKGGWEIFLPEGINLSEKPLRPMQKQFVIYGKYDDKTLLEVLELHRRIPRMYPITAIDTRYGGFVIEIGDQNIEFPFGSYMLKQPFGSVTMKKGKEDWEFVRSARVADFNPTNGVDIYGFPLLPKSSQEELDFFINKAYIDDSINQNDVRKVCEIVLRLRKIDYRILKVIENIPGHITVTTGEVIGPLVGSGHTIELKKLNGVWVVVDIYTWIS